MRDDVQYFRDLYNVQRVEVLKGPNAMIFGRGGGGGVINRVLKEADGTRVREVTVRAASSTSAACRGRSSAQAINQNVAARFNAVYENSDSFRDFGHLERYGINPTVTFRPTDDDHGHAQLRILPRRRVDRSRHSLAGAHRRDAGPATPLLPIARHRRPSSATRT